VAYLEGAFQKLMVLLLVSSGQDYITSDWPCFDMEDSDNAPILGEDLGTKPGVVAYFPISPQIAAVFFSKQHSVLSSLLATEMITRVQQDAEVLNEKHSNRSEGATLRGREGEVSRYLQGRLDAEERAPKESLSLLPFYAPNHCRFLSELIED
jgi:hypothetical protein